MRAALLVGVISACSTSSPSPMPESTQALADLRYAPLEDWGHRDVKEISRTVSRWTPKQNPNKESISIIRTPLREDLKNASPTRLKAMLTEAQGSLPSPAVQQPTIQHTKQHLQVVQVVSDFVPNGLKSSYHRVHAMIVDDGVLVHVLYTARTPDPALKMFHQVVDTIHRTEG